MLDLRLPIGAYFLLNAVILVITGVISPHQSQVGNQNINLDLVWGLVMGAFGIFMLALSFMEKKSKSGNQKAE